MATMTRSRRRQNLTIYDMSAAGWAKTNTAAATDTVMGPDGTTLAYKVTDANTTNAAHVIQFTVAAGMLGAVVCGCYVQGAELTAPALRLSDDTVATIGNLAINTSTRTANPTAGRGGIVNYADGWSLVWISASCPTAGAIMRLFQGSTASHAGTVGSGVYIAEPFIARGSLPPTLHVRR